MSRALSVLCLIVAIGCLQAAQYSHGSSGSHLPTGNRIYRQAGETVYSDANAEIDNSVQTEQLTPKTDMAGDFSFDGANGQDGAANGESLNQANAILGTSDSPGDKTADLDGLRRNIQGEPNVDYPILATVPMTGFSCGDRGRPGYYGDMEARCQVFHICQAENRLGDSFLCPNGTIFSQKDFVCVWWWQYDCAQTEQDWKLNANLFSGNTLDSPVDNDDERLVDDRDAKSASPEDQNQFNQVQLTDTKATFIPNDSTDAPTAMLTSLPEGCAPSGSGACASNENAHVEAQLLSPAAIARSARFSARFNNRANLRLASAGRREPSGTLGQRSSVSPRRQVFGRTRPPVHRAGPKSRRANSHSRTNRFGRRH
ncbi:hypothetical protein HDE_00716 [Halotydeus destructor]|nr:hypothetical protein HDE_00716 [Halotydeus destructor]